MKRRIAVHRLCDRGIHAWVTSHSRPHIQRCARPGCMAGRSTKKMKKEKQTS